MNGFVAYVCSVSAIGGMLFALWKICEARGLALWRKKREQWEVYTKDKSRADYWKGKPGSKASAAIKKEVYIRDKNKCRECGCGVVNGNANTKSEHIKAALFNHKTGNVHHVVPEEWGGGIEYFRADDYDEDMLKPNGTRYRDGDLILEMFILTCQDCNLEMSDKIDTPWCKAYLKKFRRKIFVEAPRIERNQDKHRRARSFNDAEMEIVDVNE